MDRNTIQQLYIRICCDSGFKLEWYRAVQMTATILGISPIQVWTAFPYMDRMIAIANGTDPILKIDA